MGNTIVKPKVRLVGEDGNIFNLVSLASRSLKKAGQAAEAESMTAEVFASENYEQALVCIMKYCEVV